MKKSLFYWAFLAFVGMSLTACSSGDDNIADNTTPATPDTQNRTVILTGTIGVGGDEATRAVDDEGITSWKANDPITINYQTTSGYSRATGTIKQVSSDKHFATFEAMLTNPENDGYIGFAYGTVNSADPYNAYDFTFNYSAYYNDQDGTTEGISDKRLDYACTEEGGEVKMAVDGSTATLKSTALLKNQFSMLKINLVDKDDTSTGVNATELKITIATSENFATPKATYTITLSPATNELYVALQPKNVGDKVKIVASFNNQDPAIKLDTDAKVSDIDDDDYGKFLCVYANDDDKQAYLCSSSTSPKVCEYTYGTDTKFVKGKLYSNTLNVKTLTPTAVIAHVGAITNYCTKFLALALEDVYSTVQTLKDAQSLIGGGSWLNDHTIKISDTLYDKLVSINGYNIIADGGKIDEVQENSQDANHYATTNITSAPLSDGSTSVLKGWRVPCVTDLRNILSHVSGAPSAINPLGIMDHQGKYFDNNSAGYYRGENTLAYQLNSVLFSDTGTGIDEEYYWLSSQVKDTDGNLQSSKAWRYNFAHDYFVWTESQDKSKVRLVFAY